MAKDKAYCLKHQAGNARDYFKKHHTDIKFEAVRIPEYGVEDKSRPISSSYAHKGSGEGSLACDAFPDNPNKQVFDYVAEPVNITADGKSQCLRASCYKDGIRNLVGNDVDRRTGVAESVCVAQRGRYTDSGNRTVKGNGPIEQYYEARDDGKTNALTTVQKDNAVCEPVSIRCRGRNGFGKWEARVDGKNGVVTANTVGINIAEPVRAGCMPCYATPCEWDEDGRPIKAVSCADGKVYTVYEVKDGKITIKGKEYPIKLVDGYYIIRKLTVRECMRLQTVPEWYEFPVSDTQAYKMLGNGWTVEVIRHLIRCAVKDGEKND